MLPISNRLSQVISVTRMSLYATFIGLIGGLFPALRAARLPVAQALREL